MIPLPISMHTGQIIMMAKMFAEVDLDFYDFTDTKPALTWKSVEWHGFQPVIHSKDL